MTSDLEGSPPPERVPANDFRAQWDLVKDAALAAVARVGESGWLVLGREVEAFEEALARRWGLAHCVGCGSGLDAIEIALRCLGIAPGDAVLTTPLSAFASSLAVIRAGGVPLFVDVDSSGLIDLDLAESVLESRPDVRFLLPVHLYGHVLPLRRLRELKERFELRVVEDCAQAIGARSGGAPVGSVGDVAATSFYPTKNLGCMGDGGAVLTAGDELARMARSLRDYGQTAKYEHAHLGLNSRLDELHAAILHDALLPELDGFTRRRREIAGRYQREIRNASLVLPPVPEQSESVWHLFPVLPRGDRSRFQAHLDRAGIATARHYPTLIPHQRALLPGGGKNVLTPLPEATRFAEQEVSLPIHPFLREADVGRVIEACNAWRA